MAGERPSEEEPPSHSTPSPQPVPPLPPSDDVSPGPAYLSNRTLLGPGRYRECSRCCNAGGKREELAAWCRGRLLPDLCPFEEGKVLSSSLSTDRRSQPPLSGRKTGHRGIVSASVPPMAHADTPSRVPPPPPQHSSRTSTPRVSSTPSTRRASSVVVLLPARRGQSSTPAPVRSSSVMTSPRAAASVSASPGSTSSKKVYAARRCGSCLAAGGLRAQRAELCRGRNRPWLCVYSSIATSRPSAATQSIPTTDSGSPIRRRRSAKNTTPSPPKTMSVAAQKVIALVHRSPPRTQNSPPSALDSGPESASESESSGDGVLAMPDSGEPFSPPQLSNGPQTSSPPQYSEHETNDHSSAGSEVHDESSGDESRSDDGYDPLDFASDHSGSAFEPSDDEREASVSEEEESIISDSESSAPSAEEDEDEESSADDEDELGPSHEQILVDADDSSQANFAAAPRKTSEYLTQLSFNPDGSGPYACASCLQSGGDRAALAVWCYGREAEAHCRFVPGWQEERSPEPSVPPALPGWGPRSHRTRLQRKKAAMTTTDDLFSPEPTATTLSGDANIEAVETLIVNSIATEAVESDVEAEDPEEPRARVNRSRVVYTPTGSPAASPPPVRAPSPAALSPVTQSVPLSALPSSSPHASANSSPLMTRSAATTRPQSLPRHFQPTPPLSSSSIVNGRESPPSTVRPARPALLGPAHHPTPPPSTTDPSCSPVPAVRKLPYSKTPAPSSFFIRRSPPHAPSSDPYVAESSSTPFDASSDIDSIADSTRSVTSSSPATHRYRSELAVRAADIGMTLGPAPTGRLSSSLLSALAPALRTEPTLASSVSQSAAYSLSPPPAQRRPVPTTRPPPIPAFRPQPPNSATRKPGSGLMLPPPVPTSRTRPAATSSPAAATPSPSPRKRRQRSIDSDEYSPTADDFDRAPAAKDFAIPPQRARSHSLSAYSAPRASTPLARATSRPPNSTPRKKTRLEREIARVAMSVEDDDLEWGMDEDVGDEARQWREGSVVSYI